MENINASSKENDQNAPPNRSEKIAESSLLTGIRLDSLQESIEENNFRETLKTDFLPILQALIALRGKGIKGALFGVRNGPLGRYLEKIERIEKKYKNLREVPKDSNILSKETQILARMVISDIPFVVSAFYECGKILTPEYKSKSGIKIRQQLAILEEIEEQANLILQVKVQE